MLFFEGTATKIGTTSSTGTSAGERSTTTIFKSSLNNKTKRRTDSWTFDVDGIDTGTYDLPSATPTLKDEELEPTDPRRTPALDRR